jgi:hypothetical protein
MGRKPFRLILDHFLINILPIHVPSRDAVKVTCPGLSDIVEKGHERRFPGIRSFKFGKEICDHGRSEGMFRHTFRIFHSRDPPTRTLGPFELPQFVQEFRQILSHSLLLSQPQP